MQVTKEDGAPDALAVVCPRASGAAPRNDALWAALSLCSPAVSRLDTSNQEKLTDADLSVIQSMQGVVSLILSDNNPLSDGRYAGLGRLRKLRSLALRHAYIDEASAGAIGSLPYLVQIDLTGAHFSGEALGKILGNQGLHEVYFTDCHRVAAREMGALCDAKQLRVLILAMPGAGLEGLTRLTNLEVLGLGGHPLSPEDSVELSRMKGLKRLYVFNPLREEQVGHFVLPPGLEELRLQCDALYPRVQESLLSCERLRHLTLSGVVVDDALLSSLGKIRGLERLTLYPKGDGIPDATSFAKLRSLKELELGIWDIPPDTLAKIRKGLPDTNVSDDPGDDPVMQSYWRPWLLFRWPEIPGRPDPQ